jgi:enamine deaminase RidA (YjgF/YER057c/UK114 family)
VDVVHPAGHRNGDVLARPGVDLPQGLHRRQATRVERRRISSGSSFEQQFGYSRAIRIGDRVLVAGTAPIMPDGADPPTGAYEQAKVCLEIIGRALAEAGSSVDDVVRSRVYVTDAAHIGDVGRAHAEAFSNARPVLTGVVTGLLDPRWLVEIEVEAVILPS